VGLGWLNILAGASLKNPAQAQAFEPGPAQHITIYF